MKRYWIALAALGLGWVAVPTSAKVVQAFPDCRVAVGCDLQASGGNALCNAASPLEEVAYDFIPLSLNDCECDGPGFYVVYSKRGPGTSCGLPGANNNVSIFIFPTLGPTGAPEALIFGAGYGDTCVATYGARCDARWVDHVLRTELGLQRGQHRLRFVTPHGHIDHINAEFLNSLSGDFCWRITDIAYDEDDENLNCDGGPGTPSQQCPTRYLAEDISEMPWSAYTNARRTPLSDPSQVNGGAGQFPSPLGTITFRYNGSGHTPGAWDLVLTPSIGLPILVHGAIPGPPSGPYLYRIKAHGNALPCNPPGSCCASCNC